MIREKIKSILGRGDFMTEDGERRKLRAHYSQNTERLWNGGEEEGGRDYTGLCYPAPNPMPWGCWAQTVAQREWPLFSRSKNTVCCPLSPLSPVVTAPHPLSPPGNFPLLLSNEYKVSFHRQPLKQKVCLLFQGKLFLKTHLKDLTLTNMCFDVILLVILIKGK